MRLRPPFEVQWLLFLRRKRRSTESVVLHLRNGIQGDHDGCLYGAISKQVEATFSAHKSIVTLYIKQAAYDKDGAKLWMDEAIKQGKALRIVTIPPLATEEEVDRFNAKIEAMKQVFRAQEVPAGLEEGKNNEISKLVLAVRSARGPDQRTARALPEGPTESLSERTSTAG